MPEAISQLIRSTLTIIGALFPIVNPPENIPIFLALTSGLRSADRSVLARKIALNGFTLLLVSVLVGTHILAFFGISLPVVQVGGGLVVVAAGWKLLNRPDDDAPPPPAPTPLSNLYLSRRAFFPLTLPLTVGPGSISVAIAVGANRPQATDAPWVLFLAALLGCTFIGLTIYFTYKFAERIGHLLGETAMSIFIRLSSFILLCIGVQIVWNGASRLLATIH